MSAGGAGYGGTVVGIGGSDCQALQGQAQQVADTSCQLDSDCVHQPHTSGDCTECGVVLNAASEESSLAAVRSVCLQFDQQGCVTALHSCPAMNVYLNRPCVRLRCFSEAPNYVQVLPIVPDAQHRTVDQPGAVDIPIRRTRERPAVRPNSLDPRLPDSHALCRSTTWLPRESRAP